MILLHLLTLENQRSDDESEGLFEGEEGEWPDDGEVDEDADRAADHDELGGPAVADVSPEWRRDAVAGAVDDEHGADEQRGEVELAHVRLQGGLQEAQGRRGGGDAGEEGKGVINPEN